jgi:iron(III) transport system permease protein
MPTPNPRSTPRLGPIAAEPRTAFVDRLRVAGHRWPQAMVAVAASVLGSLLATVFWRFHTGRLGRLRWLVLALAPLPAYVHALAWMAFRSEADKVFRAVAGVNLPVGGFAVTSWVLLMAVLPFAAALALLATESVPRAQIEAAQLVLGDVGVFFRVVLPLAAPILAMGAALVFLITLLDYSVPSLFQMNIYSLEIFTAFNQQREPSHALLTALPILLLSMVVVVGLASTLRRVMQAPPRHAQALARRPVWPAWFRGMQGLAAALLAAQFLVPMVMMLVLIATPAAPQTQTAHGPFRLHARRRRQAVAARDQLLFGALFDRTSA